MEAIDTFLAGQSVRDLILRFDVEFDLELRHGPCVGVLEMLRAFDSVDARDALSLAKRVGAYWCRMVQADVRYNALAGIEAEDDSRADAEVLCEMVLASPAEGPDATFAAHAAARWCDGAGKVAYRSADYTAARLLFSRAQEIATHAGLWHCLPDIRSNELRARIEETRVAGDKSYTGAAAYRELAQEVEAEARERGFPIPEPDAPAGTSLRDTPREGREFLRGLCSVLHNLSKAVQDEEGDEDLVASRRSEAIARANGDDYRLSQALLHQAMRAFFGGRPEVAAPIFEEMLERGWRRGQQIARQFIAQIQAKRGDISGGVRGLLELLDDIRGERSGRGGDVGLDLDFHAYTVAALGRVIALDGAAEALGSGEFEEVRLRYADEQLIMARSIRRVVKISRYKLTWADRIRPVYLRRIAGVLSGEIPIDGEDQESGQLRREEDVLALVEEASTRELLDLLHARASLPASDDAKDDPAAGTETDLSYLFTSHTKRKGRGVALRRGSMRRSGPDLLPEFRERLDARRLAYERRALRQPIGSTPHDPELGHAIRMFAGNFPGMVIVRYFVYGDPQDPTLAAHILRGTEATLVRRLDLDAVRAARDAEARRVKKDPKHPAPSAKYAAALSRLLLKPIWEHVLGGEGLGRLDQLVLIPTDDLFSMPLHIAFEPDTTWPLAASVPTCLSVSATAFISRSRHLLKRQQIEDDDDLCCLVHPFGGVTAEEIVGLDWPADHLFIAGTAPPGLAPDDYEDAGRADRDGIRELMKPKPEFFLFTGHGIYGEEFKALGPALVIDGDVLTQHDIASWLRLPRNKLTVLAACVTGRGAERDGGEVAGFLRALMAAGSGGLALTLWEVLDKEIVSTCRGLFRKIRDVGQQKTSDRTVDLVRLLHEIQVSRCKAVATVEDRIEACALVMYL